MEMLCIFEVVFLPLVMISRTNASRELWVVSCPSRATRRAESCDWVRMILSDLITKPSSIELTNNTNPPIIMAFPSSPSLERYPSSYLSEARMSGFKTILTRSWHHWRNAWLKYVSRNVVDPQSPNAVDVYQAQTSRFSCSQEIPITTLFDNTTISTFTPFLS